MRDVPHLRFPEFGGEWETYIIADILCIGNGRDYKQLSKGDIPVFGTGGYMTSVNECLYEGETTFIGRKGTINKPFYYNGKFWTVDTLFYTHSFKRVIPKFVYCLFQTINWLRYNEASGVPSLSKDTIEKIKVRIPQLDEQKKIAKFLSLLDERIATQNKIIEKMESLIKGITDKLLCNFSWEKVYLRSFMEFYPTNSFSWEQLSYEKGTIRNLHYGLIHGISTKSITTKTLPFISSNKADSRFVCCHNGDVAFADASEDTAEIGKAVEFTDVDNTNVVCGLHTIHGRDVKGLTIVGFKGFMFNSSYFHEQVRRVAQGTKVFSISANNLSSCYVYIPDKSEQTKITGLLYSMEMKISLSSKLLERYKIQKEHLLRQMFI